MAFTDESRPRGGFILEETPAYRMAVSPVMACPLRDSVASSTPPPPPPPPSYEKRTPNGHCTNLGGETANVGLWDNVLGSFCHSNGGDCLPYTYGTSLAKCQRICDANRGVRPVPCPPSAVLSCAAEHSPVNCVPEHIPA